MNGNRIPHWRNIETYFLTDGKSSNSISLISCYCFFLNYARYKRGAAYYFDAEQVKLIMKNNCQFEVAEPIDQYFQLYFDLVENEKEGEYLTAAEIFDYLKKQIGSSLKVNSLMGFGRKLANMSELKHKRFADGMKYLVKKK